jgi:hypothetical protein
MSLFKEHREGNDYPCHSKVKKNSKRHCAKRLRTRLKRKIEKELE